MKSQEWVLAVFVVVVVLAMVAWIKAPEAPEAPELLPTPTPSRISLWPEGVNVQPPAPPPTPLPPADCSLVPEKIWAQYAHNKPNMSATVLSWSTSDDLWKALLPAISHNEAKQMYKVCVVTGRRR